MWSNTTIIFMHVAIPDTIPKRKLPVPEPLSSGRPRFVIGESVKNPYRPVSTEEATELDEPDTHPKHAKGSTTEASTDTYVLFDIDETPKDPSTEIHLIPPHSPYHNTTAPTNTPSRVGIQMITDTIPDTFINERHRAHAQRNLGATQRAAAVALEQRRRWTEEARPSEIYIEPDLPTDIQLRIPVPKESLLELDDHRTENIIEMLHFLQHPQNNSAETHQLLAVTFNIAFADFRPLNPAYTFVIEAYLKTLLKCLAEAPSQRRTDRLQAIIRDIYIGVRSLLTEGLLPATQDSEIQTAIQKAQRGRQRERHAQRSAQRTVPIHTPAAQRTRITETSVLDASIVAEHEARMRAHVAREDAMLQRERTEVAQRQQELVAALQTEATTARIQQDEQAARQLNDQRSVQRDAEMRARLAIHSAHQLNLQRRREAEERDAQSPRARALVLIAAREKALGTLQHLENAAQHSWWNSISSLAERVQERKKLDSYSRQLNTLYNAHPDLHKELSAPRTTQDKRKEAVHTESVQFRERQQAFAQQTAERVQINTHLSPEQRLNAFLLSPSSLPHTPEGLKFAQLTQRIKDLESSIAITQPSFIQKLLSLDPAAKMKKELAVRRRHASELLANHPELLTKENAHRTV